MQTQWKNLRVIGIRVANTNGLDKTENQATKKKLI